MLLRTLARTNLWPRAFWYNRCTVVFVHKPNVGRASSTSSRPKEMREEGEAPNCISNLELRKIPYQLIENVEDLSLYCPGGYHPLQVGDELNEGRYRLVHKLGYGGYSTIWLARDLRMSKYVAVKVIIAFASGDTEEPDLLRNLRASSERPGGDIVRPLLDEFWVAGPNGRHKCLVTPPARMSLFEAKESSSIGLFQPKVAQSIIAQLIRGVAFLHSQKIVHGGMWFLRTLSCAVWLTPYQDIHLGNILVEFRKPIDTLSTPELYLRYGEPESEPVIRDDGKALSNSVPAKAFLELWCGIESNELPLGEEKISLCDFGVSFNPYRTSQYSSETLVFLRPPETRFSDKPLSFSSDIWILACTIWEISGTRPLFEVFLPSNDWVTREQVEVFGILPSEWWKKWDKRSEWFNEEGELKLNRENMSKGTTRNAWEVRFNHSIQEPRAKAGLETMTVEEKSAFEAMIWSMLRYEPEERATAEQLMQSEWMTGWGLPALKESLRITSADPEDKEAGP
ncbi:hypothetical protein AbraIFM66950_008696 [Aspergillus brasiliensis]|nr:hypothetical protein AbraIFM66950_008696 [Aspergillus brasiliensis]